MKTIKETTTIMIYSEDHKILTELCKKNENYRDKFHEIIIAWRLKE